MVIHGLVSSYNNMVCVVKNPGGLCRSEYWARECIYFGYGMGSHFDSWQYGQGWVKIDSCLTHSRKLQDICTWTQNPVLWSLCWISIKIYTPKTGRKSSVFSVDSSLNHSTIVNAQKFYFRQNGEHVRIFFARFNFLSPMANWRMASASLGV